MYSIELISTLITPITLLYIFVLLFTFGRRYLKIYTRNKILVFTQEEVKERRKEISDIINVFKLEVQNIDDKSWEKSYPAITNIEKIFCLYNELAVGINEGMYDEIYIRMVLGYEMIDFYKKYYRTIAFTADVENRSSRFMPLELLLKRWDNDYILSYRLNKYGRYL